ncbi:competence protein CoiA [Pseudalkalibacillus caeni]|nr:competence protein CoiA family protein [Pseudalkalibacillus caeni]
MLTAMRKNNEIISLLDPWEKQELLTLRVKESFSCPACKEPVRLKLGTRKAWHFAHERMACEIETEPESDYHIKGKKQLFESIFRNHATVSIEPYLKSIKQRPDLLVTSSLSPIALEFQCSTIPHDSLSRRTISYISKGIRPVWILGGNRLKRKSFSVFSLTPMDFLTARMKEPEMIYLTYYCPISQQLAFVYDIHTISPSSVFASVIFEKNVSLRLSTLINPSLPQQFPYEDWLAVKRKWRLGKQFPFTNSSFFHKRFYELGMPVSLYPCEAGIPTKFDYWFETPGYLWQSWILLKLIPSYGRDEVFSFRDIYEEMKILRAKKIIKIRNLKFLKETHYSFSIADYLIKLSRLGLLEQVDGLTFKRREKAKLPSSLEKAFACDREVLDFLYSKK